MDLNNLISIIIISMILVGASSYYLGTKKSSRPVITGLMGAVFAIVPIVGLIYVAILFNKPDLPANNGK